MREALLGFLTGFFVSGSANISNDYFDLEVYRVNQPGRPLPRGSAGHCHIGPGTFILTNLI